MSTPVDLQKGPCSRQKVSERLRVPFDPEYTAGAHNAVNVCLRVQPNEQVCVITDEATVGIAAAIVSELEKVGAPYHAWVLEELAPRPLEALPGEIVADLENSQVSIFAVQAQRNELRSRIQMTDVVNRRKIRHAHMVNINRQIMLEGMRADFLKVDRISSEVLARVSVASASGLPLSVTAMAPAGGSAAGRRQVRRRRTARPASPTPWAMQP